MTDDNKNAYETEAKDAAAAEQAATETAAAAPEAEAALDPLEILKAEYADLKDKYLRLAAEMDNLRRRTEREIKDAKTYAAAGFARDMLSVSDNLRRALDAVPAAVRPQGARRDALGGPSVREAAQGQHAEHQYPRGGRPHKRMTRSNTARMAVAALAPITTVSPPR